MYTEQKPDLEETLEHFGVPGMKWGIRRGSSRSKAKADKGRDKIVKKSRRKDVKNRRLLSDKDLTEKIGRLEKEKKLKELTDSEINGGKKATKDVMKSAGTKVATAVISGAALYAVKTALTGKVDLADMAGYLAPKPGKK